MLQHHLPQRNALRGQAVCQRSFMYESETSSAATSASPQLGGCFPQDQLPAHLAGYRGCMQRVRSSSAETDRDARMLCQPGKQVAAAGWWGTP